MKTLKRRVILNGDCFSSREAAHTYIAGRLGLPHWYGRNLDALFDSLGDVGTPTVIVLLRPEQPEKGIGCYGALMIKVFSDAARSNPYLDFRIRRAQRFTGAYRL